MATHYIPRNVKGEGRILMIFSTKALIYTGIGVGIGFLFYLLFNAIGLLYVGIGLMILFGLIGFAIATFKIPDSTAFKFTQKLGGEKIDDVIVRALKFKLKKNKIYVYETEDKGELKNGQQPN